MDGFALAPIEENPEILYKYRKWEGEFEPKTITHREVYFTPPKDFEDPLDCRVPIRYDLLTDKEIYEWYRRELKERYPRKSSLTILTEAREWANKGRLRDVKIVKEIVDLFFEKFDKGTGILCLTPKNNIKRMWEKYANNHKGFCVGFRYDTAFDPENHRIVGQLKYRPFEELEKLINPLETNGNKIMKQIIFKEERWQFEDEFRIMIYLDNLESELTKSQKTYQVPENALTEIIFGAKMLSETKSEIIEIAKTSCKHAVFKQAVINADSEIISIVDY